jgi:hypothetical protein
MTGYGADLSNCGLYRYRLWRTWDASLPRALFVMLNPSTADASVDDATIRSCIRLAKSYACGGIDVVNLMAWRATDPKDIPDRPSIAMGSGNPAAITHAVEGASIVICAWGAHPYARRFSGGALDLIRLNGKTPKCLGVTKGGAPKHPLYIKSGTPLVDFNTPSPA